LSFESLPADRAKRLYELFRPEIDELEVILKRDFSTWKSSSAKSSAVRIAA